MSVLAPVLRWPGSKWRVADWVIGHLPPHKVYVEPYFGSGGVFFNKEAAPLEIINDLDGNVVLLFKVLREQPQALADLLALTPWAKDEYLAAHHALKQPEGLSDLERARLIVTVTWQAYGKRAVAHRSGWRFRGVDQQTPMTAWQSLPDRILFAAERLAHVQISNMDACKLIRRVNKRDTLLYVDPPYLGETRTGGTLYDCEMKGQAQHAELLATLQGHLGAVVLSGYPSALYDETLVGWHPVSTTARAQSNGHREEVLWLNDVAWRRLRGAQASLAWDLGEEVDL
ncbi:DNA adenine methylase [Deinococcus sp. HMF7604]|uniref:DNA adenine methylase n=1 Tax=Deinococcus betulae TaxID=2873312 RepID=UPI001CCBEC03|nr:DNA adenine methylase [Deinococcus betulae]MBZ9752756.1 DNA adenine methylase [Deinococcus betulae]